MVVDVERLEDHVAVRSDEVIVVYDAVIKFILSYQMVLCCGVNEFLLVLYFLYFTKIAKQNVLLL